MNNKIDRKYFPIIMTVLVVAFLIRSALSIYVEFYSLEDIRPTAVIVKILYAIFEYAVIPTLVAYFISSIIFSAGVRRRVRCITRSDFMSISLIIVAVLNVIFGVINIFSLLAPMISYILSAVESFVFIVAYAVSFMILAKKYSFNPIDKYNSFRVWMGGYLIFKGLEILLVEGLYLLLAQNPTLLASYGYYYTMSEFEEILTIVTISLYAVCILAYVIINYMLKSKSLDYKEKNPEAEDKPFTFTINLNDLRQQSEEKNKDENNGDDNHNDINDIFDI